MAAAFWNQLTVCYFALTSLQSNFKRPSSSRSSVSLTFTPNFNTSQHIVSLSAILEVQNAHPINAGEVLLEINMVGEGNVPSNDYQGIYALKAADDNGVLPLVFNDTKSGMRYWYSPRATQGRITTEFEAVPREVDEHTPVAPRVDLRSDQRGLIGVGSSFIPVPPNRDTIFDIHVNWNLTNAPEGTTPAWTFGDGVKSSKTGTTEILSNTVFMVGPIQKYTRKIIPERGIAKDFGVYWYGNPKAFDIQNVASISEKIFVKMASLFEDTEDSYRIFVRFNPYRGFGGNGYFRSFVLEYDPFLVIDEDYLLYTLAHEMVHNWPMIQESENDSVEGAWYTEGVAVYYGGFLPYKFGIVNEQQFVQSINREASAYYTNPSRALSNSEAAARAWEDFEIQRLPYSRGAMYLLDVNAKIMGISKGTRSIDEPVLELLRRKKNGQKYGLEEWLDILEKEFGLTAKQDWEIMGRGELVIPASNALGPDYELVRSDQEPWELGFFASSMTSRIINGLIPSSRAAEAGLRDGDVLLRNDFLSNSADHYERNLTLAIRRDDSREINISYWPRRWEKVECYQWVKRPEHTQLEL